ncbi:MAG TPA: YhjD/YihY/BrkB family envelope integrity protein [Verrucomicrobiae bacterium]|jgi:membrane protein|nr:YhjD/YihY/BrkB family envelope integrity protein [Verrucomicrobiae bacterium]
MIARLLNYLNHDLWRVRARTLPRRRSLVVRTLRILMLSFKEFNGDQCSLRASALTFYSFLSIVPLFAMAFGIAKGFGLEQVLQTRLLEEMKGQEEAMNRIIQFSQVMLQNTQGGVIAGIGVILLFWTVMKVLTNVEDAFNHIWRVQKGRSWGRKFSDYLSFMLIYPIFLILASSLTIYVVSQLSELTRELSFLGRIGPVVLGTLQFLPYLVHCGLLTYLYIFMPNTRIPFSSGLLGGMVGGITYQVVQKIYIYFQIEVAKLGAIYGSFAALPLFLLWLQMSWIIILFGAEISFSHQYEEAYEFSEDADRASPALRRLLSLWVTAYCVKGFQAGRGPVGFNELWEKLDIPVRLLRPLLSQLAGAGILVELADEHGTVNAYQPARDIGQMSVSSVLEALDNRGDYNFPMEKHGDLGQLKAILGSFSETIQKSPRNILLKDLDDTGNVPLTPPVRA